MRKKRTLAGVVAFDSNLANSEKKVVLPAASRTVSNDKNSTQTEIVRGTEFLVDPSDCCPWRFHNRNEIWMNVEKCKDLISSIRKNGQKVPIFARKLENDSNNSWEIIAGKRRWFACNYLKIKVRVKAIEASDRECAILMNLENKDRDDISEFEDAVSYKQQLEARLFDSQDEMAAALDLKKSKLSKMLSAAKIINYPNIMNLFHDVTLLKINPVYSLVLLLEKHNEDIDLINKKAKELELNMINREVKIKANVIIRELSHCINSENKVVNVSRNYKIGEKIIFKSNQTTEKKVVFEFDKSNFSNLKPEAIKKVFLEALNEYL